MFNKIWFQSGVALIMTLIIIYMVVQVQYIFVPFFQIIATIFVPVLLAGVLFYITIPIQEFLERHKAPRWLSMVSVFLIITIVITVLSISVIPVVTEQVQNLITRAPLIQREIQSFVNTVLNQRERLPFEVNLNEITDKAFETGSSMFSSVVANAFKIIMSTV